MQKLLAEMDKKTPEKCLQSFSRNIVSFDIDTAFAFNVRNNISWHLYGNKTVIYVDFDGETFKICMHMVDKGLDVVLPIGSLNRFFV